MSEGVELEDFIRRARPELLRLAVARTGGWAAAEDLVQDVLADVHRRWSEVSGYDEPLLWARRAVLNRSISRWRSQSRERLALERLRGRRQVPADDGPRFDDEELWAALRRLPDRQFQVVLLRWFEDLTVAEVAEVLDCGEETVRTHWRRARVRLADELGETHDP